MSSVPALTLALCTAQLTQPVPGVLVIQLLSALQSNLNVAALHSEVEASALILDKVQCNLGEALLLQVAASMNSNRRVRSK